MLYNEFTRQLDTALMTRVSRQGSKSLKITQSRTRFVTTLSKIADKKLNDALQSMIDIGDEVHQGLELETLLPCAHNADSALLNILIGDFHQLPATVKTKNANTGTKIVNPFAFRMLFYCPNGLLNAVFSMRCLQSNIDSRKVLQTCSTERSTTIRIRMLNA